MDEVEFIVKPDNYKDTTVAQLQTMQEFVNDINYLIKEGFIEVEEDANGEVRVYPS